MSTEEEYFRGEEEKEREAAAAVLWAEVDQLPPPQRDALIDYYRLGISNVEKAEATGQNCVRISVQKQKGLKKLRENPRIQEIAPAYFPSLAYRGSLGFFKRNGMSSTEYVALGNMEREERGITSSYKLISPSFFDGRTSAAVARYTGVSPGVIQKLRNEAGGVYRETAEKIARFYNVPFGELFEICVDRPAPVGDPARGWKVPKSFRLADPDFFSDYSRGKIDREKIRELGANIDVIDESVKRLRGGGRANTNMARRIAHIFDVPFEQFFVPAHNDYGENGGVAQ